MTLTKDNFEPAELTHTCFNCGANIADSSHYMRRLEEEVVDTNLELLFICKDCYNELPERKVD